LWVKGRWYESFEIGEEIDHHWGRTISTADNNLFCAATLNLLPAYLDEPYAQSEGFPTVQIHPMLVFATAFGLSVEDLSEGGKGGPFLSVDRLQFVDVAHPGVTVRARSHVVAKRESKKRPAFGIVTWGTVGFDAATGGALVEFERTNLVRKEIH
jgi:acyl dehydratase